MAEPPADAGAHDAAAQTKPASPSVGSQEAAAAQAGQDALNLPSTPTKELRASLVDTGRKIVELDRSAQASRHKQDVDPAPAHAAETARLHVQLQTAHRDALRIERELQRRTAHNAAAAAPATPGGTPSLSAGKPGRRKKPWELEKNVRFYHLDMQRRAVVQKRVREQRASTGAIEYELAAHCTFSPRINAAGAPKRSITGLARRKVKVVDEATGAISWAAQPEPELAPGQEPSQPPPLLTGTGQSADTCTSRAPGDGGTGGRKPLVALPLEDAGAARRIITPVSPMYPHGEASAESPSLRVDRRALQKEERGKLSRTYFKHPNASTTPGSNSSSGGGGGSATRKSIGQAKLQFHAQRGYFPTEESFADYVAGGAQPLPRHPATSASVDSTSGASFGSSASRQQAQHQRQRALLQRKLGEKVKRQARPLSARDSAAREEAERWAAKRQERTQEARMRRALQTRPAAGSSGGGGGGGPHNDWFVQYNSSHSRTGDVDSDAFTSHGNSSAAARGDAVTATFAEQGPFGIAFEFKFKQPFGKCRCIIRSIDADSPAALRHPQLVPGLTLALVAGQSTKGLSYEAVSALLASASAIRPTTLGFLPSSRADGGRGALATPSQSAAPGGMNEDGGSPFAPPSAAHSGRPAMADAGAARAGDEEQRQTAVYASPARSSSAGSRSTSRGSPVQGVGGRASPVLVQGGRDGGGGRSPRAGTLGITLREKEVLYSPGSPLELKDEQARHHRDMLAVPMKYPSSPAGHQATHFNPTPREKLLLPDAKDLQNPAVWGVSPTTQRRLAQRHSHSSRGARQGREDGWTAEGEHSFDTSSSLDIDDGPMLASSKSLRRLSPRSRGHRDNISARVKMLEAARPQPVDVSVNPQKFSMEVNAMRGQNRDFVSY